MSVPTTDLLSPALDLDGAADAEDAAAGEGATVRHLALRMGERPFAIEIAHVREIVGMQPVTPLHDVPPYVLGLMNLRGHVIPLIDAAARIGLRPCEPDERTCIVVLSLDGHDAGLMVDRVERVIDLPVARAAPEGSAGGAAPTGRHGDVHREGDHVVVTLDPFWLAQPPSAERAGPRTQRG